MTAATRSCCIAENAPSRSLGLPTSRTWRSSRSSRAAASMSRIIACLAWIGYVDDDRSAIREIPGMNSLSTSSRLAFKSALTGVRPVTLLPGLARLTTSPTPTGSFANANTTGIADVACFAAKAAVEAGATMTSTLSRTNSIARRAR